MRATERIVAFFVLFLAAMLWPLVGIANRPTAIAGIPALVLYLFAVWVGIVVVLIRVTRTPAPAEDEP